MQKVQLPVIARMLCLYGFLMMIALIVSIFWYYYVYAEDAGKYYEHLANLVLIISCIAPGYISWLSLDSGPENQKTAPQRNLAQNDKWLNLGNDPFRNIEQPLKDIERHIERITRK